MKHRSDIQHSEWKKHCLLFGDALDFNSKYSNRNRTHKAEISSTSTKSVEIVKAKGPKIVTRLGGFHTLMSFI